MWIFTYLAKKKGKNLVRTNYTQKSTIMDLGMNTKRKFLKLYQFNIATVAFSTAMYGPLNSA